MKSRILISILALLALSSPALAQEYFQTNITDGSHSLLLMDCNIDGVLLNEGDEVGVFDPRGYCAGVGIFDEEGVTGIALWRDDPGVRGVEGFVEGDHFVCRVWDSEHEIELPSEIEVTDGPDTWHLDAFTIANLSAVGIPRIIAEQREHDFGMIDLVADEPLVWQAEISNIGNGALRIEAITAEGDSAAFVVELGDDVVEPDSTTTITVTFPSAEVMLGQEYEATFFIATNSDDDIVYHFEGEIGAPRFVIDRDTVDMGFACPEDDGYNTPQRIYDTLYVTNPGNAITVLRNITFDDSAFSLAADFEVSQQIMPGGELAVPIVFDPWNSEDANQRYAGWVSFDAGSVEPSTSLRVWLYGEAIWGNGVTPDLILHPSSLILSAFPNPFNSTTTISFSQSPHAIAGGVGGVSLRIYDLSGRLVTDLLNRRGVLQYAPTAGTHKVVWEAKDLGAGVYFVRLESEAGAKTQKIVLMR